MKNRHSLFIIITLFILISTIFAFHFWSENSKTKLTIAEQVSLAELDKIIFVGDYRFPPLSFVDSAGQYSGYEADLVAALGLWLGIPIEFSQMPWSEALEALNSGEAAGITGMRITSERALAYTFTEPYWETSYGFVYKAGNDHQSLLELDQPVIIARNKSVAYDYFLENYFKDGMSFIRIDNPEEAVALLLEGEADIWFENFQLARYEALKSGMLDMLGFFIIPESVGYYAFALGADYEYLAPIINKALLNLEKEQILSDLDRKWFGLIDSRTGQSTWSMTLPLIAYIVLSLFLLIMFWNRFLQLKIDLKTEELSRSEKKFRAAFEGSHDSVFITSVEGVSIDCNKNTPDLFGFSSKKEFLAANQQQLFPVQQQDGSDSQNFYQEIVRSIIESGNSIRFEWMLCRKDGEIFPADMALSTYMLDGAPVVQVNVCDITDRKKLQEQLESLSLRDQLTGLYNRTYFEAELLRLKDSRSYPITLISVDIDGLKLINDTFGHQKGDQQLIACAEILQESLRSYDILARVGGDEFCALMPNTDQDTAESIARRIRLNVSKYNEKHFDLPLGLSLGLATAEQQDILFQDLFKQADDRMYRDKLYRSTSAKNKVVQSLLSVLAERDNYSEGHAYRLEELCRAVGKKLKLSSRQLSDLALLAKVHDLGKVGIPSHIIFKPGALSDEEWRVMKQHAEKGYRIAGSSPELVGVAEFILKHHEKWDGSGYPLGLAGEEIPLECRILSIADAYDAMTNERPYAEVKGRQEALDEIKAAAGSQFDPTLVAIFLSLFDSKKLH